MINLFNSHLFGSGQNSLTKLYTPISVGLFCILLTLLFFPSCKRDVGLMNVQSAMDAFTINDINVAQDQSIGQIPELSSISDTLYTTVKINTDIPIEVDRESIGENIPTWLIDDVAQPCSDVLCTFPFSDTGLYRIELQIEGFNPVKKLVHVIDDGVESSTEDVSDMTETTEKETDEVVLASNNTQNTDYKTEQSNPYNKPGPGQTATNTKKKESVVKKQPQTQNTSTTVNPTSNKPSSNNDIPVVQNTTPPDQNTKKKEENKTETKKTTTKPVTSLPNFTHQNVTEGASMPALCSGAKWIELAKVFLKPTQDAELISCYVYAEKDGKVSIELFKAGTRVAGPLKRTTNQGSTKIGLSSFDYILDGGATYELRVTAQGDLKIADLNPCKATGGGKILKPDYAGNTAIFKLQFNY